MCNIIAFLTSTNYILAATYMHKFIYVVTFKCHRKIVKEIFCEIKTSLIPKTKRQKNTQNPTKIQNVWAKDFITFTLAIPLLGVYFWYIRLAIQKKCICIRLFSALFIKA